MAAEVAAEQAFYVLIVLMPLIRLIIYARGHYQLDIFIIALLMTSRTAFI